MITPFDYRLKQITRSRFCLTLTCLFTSLDDCSSYLYGSAFEAGRRSSNRPFQPSSIVPTGMRIEAPRSDTVAEFVDRLRFMFTGQTLIIVSSVNTDMSLDMLSEFVTMAVKTASSPASRIGPLEKFACIPEPFQSVAPRA